MAEDVAQDTLSKIKAKKEKLEAQLKQLSAIEQIEGDEEAQNTIESIKEIDERIKGVKNQYQEQINEIKEKMQNEIKDDTDERERLYNQLSEKYGEETIKQILGGGTKTTTGGSGNKVAKNEFSESETKVVNAVVDEGMSFAEAAEELNIKGDGEGISKKLGNLVNRHYNNARKKLEMYGTIDGYTLDENNHIIRE
ncbi:MAG: host-nuclease inhibitor Gam family protein [archaeon]